MCGFLITHNEEESKFIRRRGPDEAKCLRHHGLIFQHFLLNITGEKLTQPFIDGEIFCVYNGEIYNHSFNRSDGENLIPLYKKYGPEFARHLDGEFAIALYDFSEGIAVFATDPFGTKPIWVRGHECASYQSGVPGGEKVPANTIRVVDLATNNYNSMTVRDFDFDNQNNLSYTGWASAFQRAVRKRAAEHCFIGLSSGYDTGGIALALEDTIVDWQAYSVTGAEDMNILNQRVSRANSKMINPSPEDLAKAEKVVSSLVENFTCRWKIGKAWKKYSVRRDRGSVGGALVFAQAKAEGRRVYLSGQGGDEILSDYSKIPLWSHYKGVFPAELVEWPNFCSSHQEAFLNKEECVAGSFGIEARYPYLDKQVVQEFLWLAPELKNREYKAPLADYLRLHDYPNVWDKKIGFVV